MDELCPLCLKMGSNRRIKAVQINLDEAIWMCENEECPWPFGHQVPCFLPRRVGDKWSNDWEIYKKVQKRIGSIPVSTELSLYTPPVTPIADDTTKESAKSDISTDTNITQQINYISNIFSSNTTPDDSYAPKLTPHDEYTREDINEGAKIANTIVKKPSQWSTDSSIIVRNNSVLPSIFDIDGDELTSNKISIKESCNETKKIILSSSISELLDVRNFTKIVDTVLKTSEKQEHPSETFYEVKKDEKIVSTGQRDNSTKLMPQIRSISRTNIDLPKMDCQKMMKIGKIDFQRSVETKNTDSSRNIEKMNFSEINKKTESSKNIEKTDSPVKIEKSESSIKIEEADLLEKIENRDFSKNIEKLDSPKKFEFTSDGKSVISPNQRSLDYTQSPKKCTTTITVDGSLPITLSYDLTDLEEKSEKIITLTSTSIRERIKRNSSIQRNNERDKNTELSVELPKKPIRPPAKRRVTSDGKQYEKFRFSNLKKFVPASKDSEDRSVNVIDLSESGDRVKLEKIKIVKNEKSFVPGSSVDNSEKHANNGISDLSNQLVETLNSANIESVNTGITNDNPVSESLNLSSVLDDILMEGYQNATENLNDDWLESFFTLDT